MSSKKNPGANQEKKTESQNDNVRNTGKILYSRELAEHLQDKINAIGYKLLCYGSTEESIKDKDGEPLIGITYVLDKLAQIERLANDIELVLSDKKAMYIGEKELVEHWEKLGLFNKSQEE